MSDSTDASASGSADVPTTSDKQAHYRIKQQAGRKDLWREALESSSKGDYFLISLLEVVLEDEQASAQAEEAQRAVKRLVNMEDTTVPYRANEYSEWCRSFCNEPLYKCCSVLAILGAAVVGAIEVCPNIHMFRLTSCIRTVRMLGCVSVRASSRAHVANICAHA